MIIIAVWLNPIQTGPSCCLFYVFRALQGPFAALGKRKKSSKGADFNRILFDIATYMTDSNVHDDIDICPKSVHDGQQRT